jgi:uncharacterized YigZ family protein
VRVLYHSSIVRHLDSIMTTRIVVTRQSSFVHFSLCCFMTTRSDKSYLIATASTITETIVVNSRFITNITRVSAPQEARDFLQQIRSQMPDASHYVYAFRVGHGNSVIEGMSDDGEPSGTAGPPILAVLRGRSDIGDIIVVVTRYFGGTKLGTGGLVRAYTEAAQAGITNTKFELKIAKKLIGIEVPYNFYDILKKLIQTNNGHIEDETFTDEVTVIVRFPENDIPVFTQALTEASAGRISLIVLD